MLKASSYQMVEENSKYEDSYFYQIDHPSRKSLFNAIQLLYRAPYVEQDKGLPGMKYIIVIESTIQPIEIA